MTDRSRVCENCSATFTPKKFKDRPNRFCSMPCFRAWQKVNPGEVPADFASTCSERLRRWWANASPEERYARSDGMRKAARTFENRERMRLLSFANVSGRLGREHKNTVRSSCSPTTKELFWAAGFLEGEGSFLPNGQSGMVQACQVEREPLERLQRLFGGRLSARKASNDKHSPYFEWGVSGPRARGLMMTMYSLMSGRRQRQIRVGLCMEPRP